MNIFPLNNFEGIYELYKCGLNCDLNLISENDWRTFSVHSFLIAGAIPGLKDEIIRIGVNQYDETEEKTIILEGIDGIVLEQIIDYAYVRRLKKMDNIESVLSTLIAASNLQFNPLMSECIDLLQKNFDMASFKEFFNHKLSAFENELFINTLCPIAESFMLSELATKRWRNIVNLNEREISMLILDHRLNAPHEEMVWEAILVWVYHDISKRLPYLPTLIKFLRYGLISPDYIDSKIWTHPFVNKNEAVELALSKHEMDMDLWHKSTFKTPAFLTELPLCMQPRFPQTLLFVMGGWSDGSPNDNVEAYDTQSNHWVQVLQLKSLRSICYHESKVVDNWLCVIGGSTSNHNNNSCMRLDLNTFQWIPMASMHESRCFVATAKMGSKIYAMGGKSNEETSRLDSCEMYDSVLNKWFKMPSMNCERSDAGASVLNGKIYIAGGFNGEHPGNSAECFDTLTRIWTVISPMNCPRSGLKCVTHKNHIYAVGGFNSQIRLSTIERYDTETDTWTLMRGMMRLGRSNMAAEVIGDRIYVTGGYSYAGTIRSVEVYEIYEDKWYEACNMTFITSGLSSFTISGVENVQRILGSSRSAARLRVLHSDDAPKYISEEDKVNLPIGYEIAVENPLLFQVTDDGMYEYLSENYALHDNFVSDDENEF